MASDPRRGDDGGDDLLVVGSAPSHSEPPPPSSGRRGPWLAVAAVVVAAGLAAIVAASDDADTEPSEAGPVVFDELGEPEADLPAPPTSEPSQPPAPALAEGWRPLQLPGLGVLHGVDHHNGWWMALASEPDPGVWRSGDAMTWTYWPLPPETELGLVADVAVDGEGNVVVVGRASGMTGPPSRAWISLVDTSAWRELPLEGADSASVEGLGRLDGVIHAYGAVDGRAAVWRLGDGGLSQVPFRSDPGVGSVVRGIAEELGRAAAYGRSADGPTVWAFVEGRFRYTDAPTPLSDRPEAGFVDIAPDVGRGAVGIISGSGIRPRLVESPNLFVWAEVDTAFAPVEVEGDGNRTVAFGTESFGQSFLLVREGVAGWEEVTVGRNADPSLRDAAITDLAIAAESVVLGGGIGQRPALWVWGTAEAPSWSVPPTTRPAWSEVATLPLDPLRWDAHGVVVDDSALLATDEQVWWIPDRDEPSVVIPARLGGPWRLVRMDGEVFALATRGASFARYLGEATWRSHQLWSGGIAGVTRIDGEWIVFGHMGPDASPVIGRSDDGESWRVETLPELPGGGVFAPVSVPGMLLHRSDDQPGAYLWSTDGRTWEQLPTGELVSVPGGSPAQVVESDEGITRLRLLTDGPEGSELEVPLTEVSEVYGVPGALVVRGAEGLWHQAGETWQRLPLHLARGVWGFSQSVVAAPEGPLLLDEVPGELRLLTWPEER